MGESCPEIDLHKRKRITGQVTLIIFGKIRLIVMNTCWGNRLVLAQSLGFYLKDSIHFMLDKGSLLAFQQHARLQTFKTVPHVLGDVGSIKAILMAQDARLHDFTLVVVGQHPHPTLQYDEGLVLGGMVMYRNLRAWLQSIEETVTFVLKALMKVVVHPEPWRLLGLVGQVIHQLIIYNLHHVGSADVFSHAFSCVEGLLQVLFPMGVTVLALLLLAEASQLKAAVIFHLIGVVGYDTLRLTKG